MKLILLALALCISHVCHAQLTGGGCILVKYPEVQELLHAQPRMIYPPYHSSAPVQGLHLAIQAPLSVQATWMNPAPPSDNQSINPECRYGSTPEALKFNADGIFYTYTAGMFNHILNTAIMDLTAIPCSSSYDSDCSRTFSYTCGDPRYGFAPVQQVQILGRGMSSEGEKQIAIVGDMSVPHGQITIDRIADRIDNKTQGKGVSLLLHAGDISYANHYNTQTHNNSYVWVDYMNSLQSVAARIPYMTAPGNHEAEFGFAPYLNWLLMPILSSNSTSPFWFSFDYMGVHFLSFSTEHNLTSNSTQWQWIKQDLIKASKNRALTPWIVMFAHRPLYCSSMVCHERCHVEAPKYRSYLEDLINQYQVDVVIAGHNHQYERSYPVYNQTTVQKNYTDPQAPVYIVNGAAGCVELNDPTFEPDVDWRAAYKASMRSGYLLMMPSPSQLSFHYLMSHDDSVYDTFTIVKTKKYC